MQFSQNIVVGYLAEPAFLSDIRSLMVESNLGGQDGSAVKLKWDAFQATDLEVKFLLKLTDVQLDWTST